MNERDNILNRIREALRTPAPRPGLAHDQAPAGVSKPAAPQQVRAWLPAASGDAEGQLALFRKNVIELRAELHLLEGHEALARRLIELRSSEGWTRVGSHAGELTDFACNTLALPVCRTDAGYEVKDLECCSVGITECDALVAQTGSVLVSSRSAGGRVLSVLPPHHVVLARREQLIGDLPEAFALLKTKYGANYPSFISFITGPSRTGDIERILVLGAHGPKKLTICCLG